MHQVAENLQKVRADVAEAAAVAGRLAAEVTVMAVSKTWPAEHVQLAVDAGQRVFGENKVQEGEIKIPVMAAELEWHMIGRLQRNKVRKSLSLFKILHSVDSLKLAKFMNRVAGELDLVAQVYLQVNIGAEPQKSGFIAEDLRLQFDQILELQNLKLTGLMCIPPIATHGEETRKWFAATRELKEQLELRSGCTMPGLSMGMSSDYRIAIEEGSTIVRIGSSIFGARSLTK